jgi:thioredoxin reductase
VILEGYEVTEIAGETSADAVVIARAGTKQRIAVHGVFVALDLCPNSTMVQQLTALDAHGFIQVNAAHETPVPGLFAAGDVATAISEQVLIAIGDGARAARSAFAYLLAQRLAPAGKPSEKEPA